MTPDILFFCQIVIIQLEVNLESLVHIESNHFVWSFVLSILRQRFWIIKAQSTMCRYLCSCMFCQMKRAKPEQQIMAPLPREHLIDNVRAFTYSGTDFFVPYKIVEYRKNLNCYGCIFICFSTRMVCLEVCDSMNTSSFLNAFFRFCHSHGNSTRELWCDNSLNLKAGVSVCL